MLDIVIIVSYLLIYYVPIVLIGLSLLAFLLIELRSLPPPPPLSRHVEQVYDVRPRRIHVMKSDEWDDDENSYYSFFFDREDFVVGYYY